MKRYTIFTKWNGTHFPRDEYNEIRHNYIEKEKDDIVVVF